MKTYGCDDLQKNSYGKHNLGRIQLSKLFLKGMLFVRSTKLKFSSYEKSCIGEKKPLQKRVAGMASMLVKTGLCVGACAVVLISSQNEKRELAIISQAQTDEIIDDLGKLKFVSMPGTISVYSPSEKLQAPLANALVEFGDSYAVFTARADQEIFSMISGNVRYISEDSKLGGLCVSIMSPNDDTELILSGLNSCILEEGQNILQGDSIGAALETEEVFVRLLKNGRPVDLNLEYIGAQ